MGSGSTLDAARRLGLRAIGIEIDERWAEVAAQRMAQTVMPFGAEDDAADNAAQLSVSALE